MAYSVHKVESSGATFDDFRFRPTVGFELRHDDGTVAARTGMYFSSSLTSRQIGGYRLQMAKLLPRYEAYLKKTGKRWEVEQEEKRIAKRDADKKANRIKWLKANIPLLQKELEELTCVEMPKGVEMPT